MVPVIYTLLGKVYEKATNRKLKKQDFFFFLLLFGALCWLWVAGWERLCLFGFGLGGLLGLGRGRGWGSSTTTGGVHHLKACDFQLVPIRNSDRSGCRNGFSKLPSWLPHWQPTDSA